MIASERKDLPATNLLAVLQSPRLAPDAEIPKEIEDVTAVRLTRYVRPASDGPVTS